MPQRQLTTLVSDAFDCQAVRVVLLVWVMAPQIAFAQSNHLAQAESCIKALDEGRLEDFEQLSKELKEWPYVFDVTARRLGAECLTRGTGDVWRYSTVEGTFISGVALEAEIERSDPVARAAREAKEREAIAARQAREVEQLQQAILEREVQQEAYRTRVNERACELLDVISRNSVIVEAYEAFEAARLAEISNQTVTECRSWYEEDRRGALTNQVCSHVLSEVGMPMDRPEAISNERVLQSLEQVASARSELSIIQTLGVLPEDAQLDEAEDSDPYNCK